MAKAVDKAYQTVRERIVRGVYPAACRITEQEVAAVAGVSRTPVREALRKLHAEGLLEFIPHQGAIVAEWLAASNGLGYLVLSGSFNFNTARTFVAIIALAVIGTCFFSLMSWIERLVSWKRHGSNDSTTTI